MILILCPSHTHTHTAIQSSSNQSLPISILDTTSFVQPPVSTSSIITSSIQYVTDAVLEIQWELGTVLNPLNTSGMIQLNYTAAVLESDEEEITLILDVSTFVSDVMVARSELKANTLNPILVIEETTWVVSHLELQSRSCMFYLYSKCRLTPVQSSSPRLCPMILVQQVQLSL